MTASELWRTTGHVDSSAHTQDVHTKREGGCALRDKALWVTGLVSKVNAYSILTARSRTTGMHGSHLPNIRRIHGLRQPRRRHLSISLSDICHRFISQPDHRTSPHSNNVCQQSKKPGTPLKKPNVKRKNLGSKNILGLRHSK